MKNLKEFNEYTETNWQEDLDNAIDTIKLPDGRVAQLGLGTANLPCPNCNTLGFYGPRIYPKPPAEPNRKYRACKFCGLWQDVSGYPGTKKEGKLFYCIPIRCSNPACKTFQYTESNLSKPCEKECGGICKEDKWPVDDPDHEWHKDKKQIYELLGI